MSYRDVSYIWLIYNLHPQCGMNDIRQEEYMFAFSRLTVTRRLYFSCCCMQACLSRDRNLKTDAAQPGRHCWASSAGWHIKKPFFINHRNGQLYSSLQPLVIVMAVVSGWRTVLLTVSLQLTDIILIETSCVFQSFLCWRDCQTIKLWLTKSTVRRWGGEFGLKNGANFFFGAKRGIFLAVRVLPQDDALSFFFMSVKLGNKSEVQILVEIWYVVKTRKTKSVQVKKRKKANKTTSYYSRIKRLKQSICPVSARLEKEKKERVGWGGRRNKMKQKRRSKKATTTLWQWYKKGQITSLGHVVAFCGPLAVSAACHRWMILTHDDGCANVLHHWQCFGRRCPLSPRSHSQTNAQTYPMTHSIQHHSPCPVSTTTQYHPKTNV